MNTRELAEEIINEVWENYEAKGEEVVKKVVALLNKERPETWKTKLWAEMVEKSNNLFEENAKLKAELEKIKTEKFYRELYEAQKKSGERKGRFI